MSDSEAPAYRAAGVDIAAADRLVALLRARVTATRPEVTAGIGGFYGGFRLPDGTELVAGADGVGTKILLARELGRFDTIGIDLVAMNVNDILTAGAEPLFFLDYVAVGRLEPEQVAEVVAGIDRGCREAGCALLGGETAEMPGLYRPGDLDLAGFAVGRVLSRRHPAPPVSPGFRIVGIAASGLHANGFSLVRAILERARVDLRDPVGESGTSWAEELLRPTRIYVRPVLDLCTRFPVAAMAHITGGGLVGNLPRVLGGFGARLAFGAWPVPPVMRELQRLGGVTDAEMARVFNLGVGYCLVVPPEVVADIVAALGAVGWPAWDIGVVVETAGVSGL
ncbi:MAG: phosphoribosylformylglycinamidine cyclo-ligase [Actinomycetia bacterium]|nr:phosphoribosylformylglycinamidine cyclo-ligase [Actinomycetes bacterium]